LPARQLCLRQRMEAQNLHAARERIGERRDEEHVGGTREDEAAWGSAAIHCRLDRGEQAGHVLDFVENDALGQVRNESDRIGFGSGARCGSYWNRLRSFGLLTKTRLPSSPPQS